MYRIVSIAGIVAGAGAVCLSGCGSTTIVQQIAPDASDLSPTFEGTSSGADAAVAVHDAGQDVLADASTDAAPDVFDPNACPQNVALSVADLDKEVGWKPPAAITPGACSAADVMQLEANFKDPKIKTYFELGNGLTASCKSCTFSNDTDANWQPIVGTAANNGGTGFINFGACFGALEGASCGKAHQYEQFCYSIACNACTSTSTDRQKCVGIAGGAGGMCETFRNTTLAACPSFQATASTCSSIFDAVRKLCGE